MTPKLELPEDVLRRLALCFLAVSRCVCKAWRDTVDSHRLLRADLLPRSLRGLFIDYMALYCSDFLSRPSTGPAICSMFDFLPDTSVKVKDHCNGLLLCCVWRQKYIVNPATRRWARLPPYPPSRMGKYFHQNAYLVFDPTVSPHYEVFLIPCVPCKGNKLDPATMELEWPPASYTLHVFSSVMGLWEERTFSREGEAAGLVSNMVSRSWFKDHRAVHWRGALYVHCQHDFVIRISLSNCKYQVIRPPASIQSKGYPPRFHLGKSEKGVYCARSYEWHGLQI